MDWPEKHNMNSGEEMQQGMGSERGNETHEVNVRNEAPGGEAGHDEQDVLLREIFYLYDAGIGRTTEGATSRRSRSTTDDIPYSFESSNDYEGLENNRHAGGVLVDSEVTMAEPGDSVGGEVTSGVGIANPPPLSKPP